MRGTTLNEMTVNSSEPEIVLTRIFNFPRDLVYQAFTNPEHMQHWWGPHNWTHPEFEMDVRTGGSFRMVMRDDANGIDYETKGVFREVVPLERLVMVMDFSNYPNEWFAFVNLNKERGSKHELIQTMTFDELAGKTKLTIRVRFQTFAVRDTLVKGGVKGFWDDSFERLDYALNPGSTFNREVYATRLFAAPRELVFKMWTDPDQLVQWWGPNGFTTTTHEIEVRPGGSWRFVMHGPDGRDYKGHIVFLEVVPNERIVYEHRPVPGEEPLCPYVTVEFNEEDGKTRLTWRMIYTSTELRNHIQAKYGVIPGLQQTVNRLVALATNAAAVQ